MTHCLDAEGRSVKTLDTQLVMPVRAGSPVHQR